VHGAGDARAGLGRVRAEHLRRLADSFDQILENLQYRAPALVAEAAADVAGAPEGRLDILDAGCGTGLCGEHVKPFARRLVGVDLSLEMLKRAGVRKLYDDLILGELTAFVGAAPAAWDLVVSADTLVYFGDLAPVMAAALRGLRPGGHLVLPVERASDAEAPQGSGSTRTDATATPRRTCAGSCQRLVSSLAG
jgi:predicted TPR repeat methyltransferase